MPRESPEATAELEKARASGSASGSVEQAPPEAVPKSVKVCVVSI